MEYKAEFIKDILDELKPLLEGHWKEVAWYQDKIKLCPSYDKYIAMQEANSLLCITVRDEEGKLIGYNINFIHHHPHYSDHIYAINDIIFVLPEHRHTEVSKNLIEATEQVLRHLGVSVVTLHMKPDHQFMSLVESCGFEQQEYVYSKYLGE